MTHIRMLETRRGSEDAFTVRRFMKGETYDVADLLARQFIGSGYAVKVGSVEDQNLQAAESTLTQGEMLYLLGKLKHVYPDVRIFNPQEDGHA